MHLRELWTPLLIPEIDLKLLRKERLPTEIDFVAVVIHAQLIGTNQKEECQIKVGPDLLHPSVEVERRLACLEVIVRMVMPHMII